MRKALILVLIPFLLVFGLSFSVLAGGPNDGVGLPGGLDDDEIPPVGGIRDEDRRGLSLVLLISVPPPEDDEPGLDMLAPCDHAGCIDKK